MVLKSWLGQEEVEQIIVFDNSGFFKTKLPVLVISNSQNLEPQGKFVCAQFAKNDLIIFADDDVVAKPNFVNDLLKYFDEGKVMGIVGKCFTGSEYYKSSGYVAKDINEPKKVDYLCGLIMLTHRKNCFVDVRKCPSKYLDDWWWEHELKDTQFYVIPSKNYELLPESNDANALHKQSDLRTLREKYFKRWRNKKVTDPHRLYYQRSFDDLLLTGIDLVGAEIGVYRGAHAKEMLEKLDIKTLYLIDPWKDYDEYGDLPIIKEHLPKAYKTAKFEMLKHYEDRLIWLKEHSSEAVKKFEDNSFDFVYIDGNHCYEYVKEDIELWYPKVKRDGVIGGHDYHLPRFGVKKAVDEFYLKNNLVLHLKKNFQSKNSSEINGDWWIYKK